MKYNLLAASVLLAIAGTASAAPSLSWSELAEVTPNAGFDPDSGLTYSGTSFASAPSISLGKLSALGVGPSGAKVTYTFLGKEAGYPNDFYAKFIAPGVGVTFTNTPESAIGAQASVIVTSSGLLNFSFEGYTGNFAHNNGAWDANASFGLIKENYTKTGLGAGHYDMIIGYNDTYTPHNDWDDMVIGVNIAPIPEPETYAMLLAGLGLMGFVARRRKKASAV